MCESYRIQECLGGDDPLLILDVNRGQPIGAGASVFSYFGPFLASTRGPLSGTCSLLPPLGSFSCPGACFCPVFPSHCGLGAFWVPWWAALRLLVTGSLLPSPLLWGLPVCLVVIAFTNPGFHLVQTNGLSQAVYQAYACGDQSFLWRLTPGPLTVLPSWGIAYHALFLPCLMQGLGWPLVLGWSPNCLFGARFLLLPAIRPFLFGRGAFALCCATYFDWCPQHSIQLLVPEWTGLLRAPGFSFSLSSRLVELSWLDAPPLP